MRWFWLFILGLCVLTGVLYVQRTSAQKATADQLQATLEAEREETSTRRPKRSRSTDSETSEQAAEQSSQQSDDQTDLPPDPEPISEPIDQEGGGEIAGFDPSGLIDTMNEMRDQLPEVEHARAEKPSAELQPASTPTDDQSDQKVDRSEPVGEIVIEGLDAAPDPNTPSYELRADGSFKVLSANAWVQGGGTEAEPFVLSWDVLSSIDKTYNPKKGNDTLPDWLDLLEGKVVTIEGNTLVPVVATTTRELLIMKNPWDGCCIGVPPTPYDAVEISLDHDVDFGNSAVGYGSVVGTFYVDPYVVDGWVLGVYIIEDAKYRSGEGVIFPEF